MDIKRDKYLKDLMNRMHNGMIKVVTGIRRCGKSYLLFHIFKNYLLEQGVPASHIIMIELDQRKNKKYRDPDIILSLCIHLDGPDIECFLQNRLKYSIPFAFWTTKKYNVTEQIRRKCKKYSIKL